MDDSQSVTRPVFPSFVTCSVSTRDGRIEVSGHFLCLFFFYVMSNYLQSSPDLHPRIPSPDSKSYNNSFSCNLFRKTSTTVESTRNFTPRPFYFVVKYIRDSVLLEYSILLMTSKIHRSLVSYSPVTILDSYVSGFL